MLPPVTPSIILDKKSKGRLLAKAKIRYPKALPNWEIIKIFFRPKRSESFPKTGAARS